jgi:hypothetical protein
MKNRCRGLFYYIRATEGCAAKSTLKLNLKQGQSVLYLSSDSVSFNVLSSLIAVTEDLWKGSHCCHVWYGPISGLANRPSDIRVHRHRRGELDIIRPHHHRLPGRKLRTQYSLINRRLVWALHSRGGSLIIYRRFPHHSTKERILDQVYVDLDIVFRSLDDHRIMLLFATSANHMR